MTQTTLFRNATLASGAILALCGLAHAQQPQLQPTAAPAAAIVTESVKLRFAKPTELVRQFMRPVPLQQGDTAGSRSFVEGMALFVPNDVAGTVTLSGSAAKIQEYKALIRFLDIAPRTMRLQIRLLRYEFTGGAIVGSSERIHSSDDKPKLTGVAWTEADAANDTPAELSLVAGKVLFYGNVVPHVNGDGSITLATKMRIRDVPEEIDWKTVSADSRRVGSGKSLLFIDDRGTNGATVLYGTVYSRLAGVNSGYYLEITPLLNPATPEKP